MRMMLLKKERTGETWLCPSLRVIPQLPLDKHIKLKSFSQPKSSVCHDIILWYCLRRDRKVPLAGFPLNIKF